MESDRSASAAARRRAHAASFGQAAALYHRARPSYPAQAIRWALAPLGMTRSRIADIGAGTGIMSRLLVGLGHDVVAVEPDEQMRQVCAAQALAVEIRAGTAESVPLPDASVDAAVAAQAYHWFDTQRAHAELARVIRPGGILVAIWNDRDESTPWVAEYTRIVAGDRDGVGPDGNRPDPRSFGDCFGPVQRADLTHAVTHTAETLVALLASRSYYLTAAPARQVELADDVRRLTTTHPDLAGRPDFELPYRTRVYRAVRKSD